MAVTKEIRDIDYTFYTLHDNLDIDFNQIYKKRYVIQKKADKKRIYRKKKGLKVFSMNICLEKIYGFILESKSLVNSKVLNNRCNLRRDSLQFLSNNFYCPQTTLIQNFCQLLNVILRILNHAFITSVILFSRFSRFFRCLYYC